jgi:hypothetical protein
LELDAVREKATKRHGWDEGKAKALENEYRDFLILLAENDGKTISPWRDDLDLLWHEHILDTRRYAQDCKWIFGHFIQHDPHIEKRPYHHAETRRATMALREVQLRDGRSDGSSPSRHPPPRRRATALTSRPGVARPIRNPQLTEPRTATRAERTVDTAAVTRAEATAAVGTAAAPDVAAGTEAAALPPAREKARDVRRQAAGGDRVQDDEGQADDDDPKVRGAEVEEHGAGSLRRLARSIRKAGTWNFTGSSPWNRRSRRGCVRAGTM